MFGDSTPSSTQVLEFDKTTANDSSGRGPVYPESAMAQTVWRVGSPILLIVGTVGNLLSVLVLTRKRLRRTTTMFYLTVLAFADLAVLFTGLLRLWLDNSFGIYLRLQSNTACRAHTFLVYFSLDFSVWVLVAVTVDRCLYVSAPFRSRRWSTLRNARVVVVIIAVILFIINMHYFWTVSVVFHGTTTIAGNEYNTCFTSNDVQKALFLEKIWPWVDFSVVCLVPFIVMAVCNSLIVRHLVLSSRKLRRHAEIELKTEIKKDGKSTNKVSALDQLDVTQTDNYTLHQTEATRRDRPIGTLRDIKQEHPDHLEVTCHLPRPISAHISDPGEVNSGQKPLPRFWPLVSHITAKPQPRVLSFENNTTQELSSLSEQTQFQSLRKCTTADHLGHACGSSNRFDDDNIVEMSQHITMSEKRPKTDSVCRTENEETHQCEVLLQSSRAPQQLHHLTNRLSRDPNKHGRVKQQGVDIEHIDQNSDTNCATSIVGFQKKHDQCRTKCNHPEQRGNHQQTENQHNHPWHHQAVRQSDSSHSHQESSRRSQITVRRSAVNGSDGITVNRRGVHNVTLMLLTVNTLFWLLMAPIVTFVIGYAYWRREASARGRAQLSLGWSLVNMLQYTNNVIHFFLYCMTGPKFRQELASMCGRSPKHQSRVQCSGD